MNRLTKLSTFVALAILAVAPPASAEDSEIAELKAMVQAMQKTIAEQNARIATLEKRAADRASYVSRLAAVYQSELAKKLPEYERHAADIKDVMGTGKR